MQQILNPTGTAAGLVGSLLCAIAGTTRLMGQYYLGGYEATTLFTVGTGLMIFGCLIKLEVLLERTSNYR